MDGEAQQVVALGARLQGQTEEGHRAAPAKHQHQQHRRQRTATYFAVGVHDGTGLGRGACRDVLGRLRAGQDCAPLQPTTAPKHSPARKAHPACQSSVSKWCPCKAYLHCQQTKRARPDLGRPKFKLQDGVFSAGALTSRCLSPCPSPITPFPLCALNQSQSPSFTNDTIPASGGTVKNFHHLVGPETPTVHASCCAHLVGICRVDALSLWVLHATVA